MKRPRAPVGRSTPRPDGRGKVDGTAQYPADVAHRAEYHAATVRAPVACARLERIDASRALAVPGVVRVLTAADVRGSNRFGLLEPDQPVLVERDIVGASDVIAVVIARSAVAAREGARQVQLAVTPRVPVFDPVRALDHDAPRVHAHRPNLLAERSVNRGDVTRALARAAIIMEGEYRTGFVDHAFLSPEAGLAYVDDQGRLAVATASQWPEADLRQAAEALGEPFERLRLIQTAIGGAFGGREDISLQILLLLAAREMRAPVHMAWDRAESVRGHGKRHPFIIRHTLGADRAGRIVAARVDYLVDAGCYASSTAKLLDNALIHVTGPYAVKHVNVRGRAVLTNNPFTCAFRGFGVNQMTFAMEQQVSKLAHALNIDPAVLRERNLVGAKGTLGAGTRVHNLGALARSIREVRARGASRRLPRPANGIVCGRGLATAIKNLGYGFGFDDKATALVHVTRHGAVVRVGAADVGQGTETIVAQIAASELQLPMSRIRVEWQDNASAPESGSSSSSRQTMAAGNAVLGACRLAARAVTARGGESRLPDEGILKRFTWRFPKTDKLDTRRSVGKHIATFSAGACVADVSVDTVTGQVRVLRIVSAVDAGRMMNPLLVRGQVEGGAVMGQGYALTEECATRDGLPTTPGFDGTGIPTAVDAAPKIETIVLESADHVGPLGARGIGEITMIPVVPAIIAAIHDACGVWIDELPANPERIRAALATIRSTANGEPT